MAAATAFEAASYGAREVSSCFKAPYNLFSSASFFSFRRGSSLNGVQVGFGAKPALLIVDFQKGFTDPKYRLGRSPRILAARDATIPVAKAAREKGIPVASCGVGWQSARDIQHWKVAVLKSSLHFYPPRLHFLYLFFNFLVFGFSYFVFHLISLQNN